MLQLLLYGLIGYLALCYLGGALIAVRLFILHEYRDQPYEDVEMRFDDAIAAPPAAFTEAGETKLAA